MDMDQQHHLRFLRILHREHALYLRKLSELYRGHTLKCALCGDDIHPGSEYYCCEEQLCAVFVHKHPCAEVQPLLLIQHHPSHPQHSLTLHMSGERISNCHFCKIRGQYVRDWIYGCESCSDFNLHARCAVYTLPDSEGEVDGRPLQHKVHIHEHPLSSLFVKLKKRFDCERCKMFIKGESYVCYGCGIFFHKACIDAPREIQHHPFHPQHTLELIYDDDSKLRYSCRECDFNSCSDYSFKYYSISTLISTLPHKEEDDVRGEGEGEEESRSAINHFAHKHPLNPFHATMEIEHFCEACDKRIVNGFYGCIDCNFLLHESLPNCPPKFVITCIPTTLSISLLDQKMKVSVVKAAKVG